MKYPSSVSVSAGRGSPFSSVTDTSSGASGWSNDVVGIARRMPRFWSKSGNSATKVSVTVTMPEEFTPTDTAAGVASFDKFVRMTIVVRNGTGQVYEGIELSVKATTGGKRASRVIDDGMDLPKEKIQPGKSQTFGLGFGYTPGQEFALTVNSLGKDRPDAVYTVKL